ncbi:MAG: glutaminase [Solirubrobacterales bacterium]
MTAASPIDAYLARLHEQWRADSSGAVADYIPPLALADPAAFAIAIATTEGRHYGVGDSRERFTIQSISKPFTYGLALADRGFAAVDAKVGIEPSGEAFNSISLAPDGGYEIIGRTTREVGSLPGGR